MAVKAKDKVQQKVIDEAWLHLPDWYDEDSAFNPLLNFPESSKENPHIFIIWLMSNPEYFAFFCKYVLNFELLPMQLVILQEMWYRKFPMLIGSRGLGKCVKNGRILTDSKVCKIEDIVPEDYPELQRYYPEKDILVFGENGFNKVEYAWKNPKEKTVKIKTDYRYKLEGTQHHPIRVVRDGEIVWKEMSELKLGDIVPIDRTPSWITKPNNITPDVAYWMGALVGDGGYTSRKAISFTNQDKEVVDLINKTFIKLYGKGLTPRGSKGFEYQICAVNIWDDLFSKYGFGSPICEEKDVPSTILASSKECVAMFLRGLMDTDGYVEKNGASLQLSAKSPYIIYNVQFLLTRFGIISKVRKSWNKKYQRYYYKLDISGDNIDIYIKEIGFTIDYKKDRLALTSKTRNTNKDVIPHALVLKDLLSLRDKYVKIRKPTPRGNNYERKLITPSRLKKYEISYLTLSKILEITKDCSHEKEWIRLKDIFDKHYFYDEIVEIKSGFSETYDVHIPNDHSFISNGFISHNTSLMAIYTILRLLFLPKRKVVVAGASFRQSKLVFEYMETIWNNSPVLRDLCGPNQGPSKDVDMYKFRILDSVSYFLPIGDGSKIRGLRANDILIDEFASHQKEIFETVISGFGAVSSAPLDNVRLAAAKRKAEELGVWEEDVYESKLQAIPNQIILSGTAYYDFNHFADYWKSWHKIIESRGNKEKLIQALGGPDKYDPSLSHTHFSIMRIPFEIIPEGFMDAAQVARSRATFDSGTYSMEFGSTFSKDSNGFFKRSLIESCSVNPNTNFSTMPEGLELFEVTLHGRSDRKYVYGIDPASEVDRFAIVILEIHNNHRRIVYCWTTNKKEFQARVKSGVTKENEYYSYCARKIRELMKRFPTDHIAIDSQGGGYAVLETLHDKDKINSEAGELPMWEWIDPTKAKDSDGQSGLHNIYMVNFSSADYTRDANHGLKADFENKVLLFPFFDSISLGEASLIDASTTDGITYDSLDDCIMDIEELKDELSSIVMTQTPSGREHWDTPEVKVSGSKKGRLRKDRYSALLMANMLARNIRPRNEIGCTEGGGFATYMTKKEIPNGPAFIGPAWFVDRMRDIYE